ncbi:biotin synthase BioB [Candidatus Fokinia crypta]|uniref:Biotin synthase n=1 Tax=Candidatus Fokinia crypta TaxID=1920990 RepID=A0ABZ0UUX1_9RICK|nr:biotin synthase BioB [Candidatus Fokinia cryptica]WPX97880.1 Biotin synthase [Candidatus Fokinia cryptica]
MEKKWAFEEAKVLFELPFNQLVYDAQTVHRQHFLPNTIQISTLLSIKTGGCTEDCKYCPQSMHHNTGVEKGSLLGLDEVMEEAKEARKKGASRFCMGAAWRSLRDKDMPSICEMIREVKKLGLEVCMTLGLLKEEQAVKLKEAGLDFYNHNIDTSEEFYSKVITTRNFQSRLDTIECVRKAGIKVCCGGIIGMGETNNDRIKMLVVLANLDEPPESIPINKLIRISGTPLAEQEDVDPFDFVRIVALARIMIPKSYVRLSAGREQMSDEMQALCFLAGANSIFYGEKLLTAENPTMQKDNALLKRLGLRGEVCDKSLH